MIVRERFDPEDDQIAPQTKQHHLKRYEFASLFSGRRYLDLCCGQGYGSALVKTLHSDAYTLGIDIDISSIHKATREYPHCRFQVANTLTFNPTVPFDVVIWFESIEHFVFNQSLFILERIETKMLDNNGVLILSTPRDIQDKYNHFHKSIWTYPVLKNSLGSLFDNVQIFGQDWDTGEISEDDVVDNDFYICVCRK